MLPDISANQNQMIIRESMNGVSSGLDSLGDSVLSAGNATNKTLESIRDEFKAFSDKFSRLKLAKLIPSIGDLNRSIRNRIENTASNVNMPSKTRVLGATAKLGVDLAKYMLPLGDMFSSINTEFIKPVKDMKDNFFGALFPKEDKTSKKADDYEPATKEEASAVFGSVESGSVLNNIQKDTSNIPEILHMITNLDGNLLKEDGGTNVFRDKEKEENFRRDSIEATKDLAKKISSAGDEKKKDNEASEGFIDGLISSLLTPVISKFGKVLIGGFTGILSMIAKAVLGDRIVEKLGSFFGSRKDDKASPTQHRNTTADIDVDLPEKDKAKGKPQGSNTSSAGNKAPSAKPKKRFLRNAWDGITDFAKKVPGGKTLGTIGRGLGSVARLGGNIFKPAAALLGGADMLSIAMDDTLSKDEKTLALTQTAGKTVGGMGGAMAGAAAGAAIGSVVPVVGTIIGGAIGGLLGGFLGEKAGDVGGSFFGKALVDQQNFDPQEYKRNIEEAKTQSEEAVKKNLDLTSALDDDEVNEYLALHQENLEENKRQRELQKPNDVAKDILPPVNTETRTVTDINTLDSERAKFNALSPEEKEILMAKELETMNAMSIPISHQTENYADIVQTVRDYPLNAPEKQTQSPVINNVNNNYVTNNQVSNQTGGGFGFLPSVTSNPVPFEIAAGNGFGLSAR